MTQQIEYQINPKENIYFFLKIIASILFYFLLFLGLMTLFNADAKQAASLYIVGFYVVVIVIYLFFRFGIFIGYLKGNAVQVSSNQFSDIYTIVSRQSHLLGLNTAPAVYILQSGGLLNAFATRFLGSNYIVLFSEIVETAYEEDKNVLEFIIGHEMGHVKRNHMIKNLILFPSSLIPFLGPAYSRACEYTCDNIGHAICPNGVHNGLLLLASGRKLFKKVNTAEYIKQGTSDGGFWKWFSEKVSSHPHLSKRLNKFKNVVPATTIVTPPKAEPYKTDDHSKYMPQ